MHIAMATHYFESHRGGVEIAAGQLARALTRLGHRVAWIACDSSPPVGDSSVCHTAVPLPANNALEARTGLPFPIPLPGASALVDAAIRDADVVVVHDAFYLPCLLAQRRARRARKPVAIVQHIGVVPYRNPLPRLAMAAFSRVGTRPALAAADQVVFISELTRRHFAGVGFQRPPQLLFNGVNARVFSPAPPGSDRDDLRRSLGLDPLRPTILFVGRFVEKKGLSHLQHMVRRRPDWDWVFAGWGPADPAGWHLSNVRVFSDRSGQSLVPLYRAADVLVLPSVGEGFPLVIQEALACGLPVVCGQDTAFADPAAQPYLVGVPVRPDDPRMTAEAFITATAVVVVQSAEGRATKSLARAAFARERYSWDTMATRLLGACASATADRANRAPQHALAVS
jgi:alpha-maltose-1-phosphate synthase